MASSSLITIFSATRMAFGAISLLIPGPVLSACHVVSSAAATGPTLHMTRMFGVRDAVVGGLLYTADNPAAVRRALIAGAVIDGVDVLACAFAVWKGELDLMGAEIVGGGAVVFLAVGLWGLMALGNGGGGAAVGGGWKGVGK